MEKDRKSIPQDTVDAAPRDTTGRESVPSAYAEEEGRDGRQASCPRNERTSNPSLPSDATNGSNTTDPNQPSDGGVVNGDEVSF